MKQQSSILFLFFAVFIVQCETTLNSQVPLCENAQPFCSDATNPTFPNQVGTTIPVGPDYGCLERIPGVNDVNTMINPQWFYFQISNSGDIELQVSQLNNSNNPIDLDFVMWGPFPDLISGCNQVMAGTPPIQCSSNPDATETIGLGTLGGGDYWFNFPFVNALDGTSTPPQGQVGEVYIVLLTNADNESGTISLQQTSGSGATDCNIITPCSINIKATPSACDPSSNTHSVSGEITFTDHPTTGTLIVEDCNGNSVTFTAPFTSPLNYTISGIASDGLPCKVTAYFSDDPVCSGTVSYQNPASCNCTDPNLVINDLGICSNGGSINLNDAIDVSSDPANSTFYETQLDAENSNNAIGNTVSNGGVYWVRAEDPNDSTCYNVYQIQVDVSNPSYGATITGSTCGNNDGKIILKAKGGMGQYQYSIDSNVTHQNNGTFSNLTAGLYDIVITDSMGCTATGVETINNLNGPSIDTIIASNPTCFGLCDGSLSVNISGGATPYNYLWTNQNGDTINIGDNHVLNLCDGEYDIAITDTNNCQTNGTVHITNPQELDASFTGLLNEYCNVDTSIILIPTQTGGIFSGPGMEGTVFHPKKAGIGLHTISYILENATCTDTQTVSVKVSGPTANFIADPTSATIKNPIVNFINQSQNAIDYTWNFGDASSYSNDNNPTHTYPSDNPGVYTVTLVATDTNNCSDTYSKLISIQAVEMDYEIPNVFTPNGDHENEFFKLIEFESIKSLEVTIFNRWGNPVFESHQVNFKWNGKIYNNGDKCNDGTYFYKISLEDYNGKIKEEQGFVHLISSN